MISQAPPLFIYTFMINIMRMMIQEKIISKKLIYYQDIDKHNAFDKAIVITGEYIPFTIFEDKGRFFIPIEMGHFTSTYLKVWKDRKDNVLVSLVRGKNFAKYIEEFDALELHTKFYFDKSKNIIEILDEKIGIRYIIELNQLPLGNYIFFKTIEGFIIVLYILFVEEGVKYRLTSKIKEHLAEIDKKSSHQ